jgi:hypothetical protein
MENRDVHVAVLDTMLGRRTDIRLADEVWSIFPETLVVHYTHHPVDQNLSEPAKDNFRGPVAIVSRRKGGGAPALWDIIREYWETQLLKRAQHAFPFAMLRSRFPRGELQRRLPVASQVRCDTIGLNTLQREIADFWEHLSKDAQKRMRELLSGEDDTSGKGHRDTHGER